MKIVVATDGSECSLPALEVGEQLTGGGDELTLLGVVEDITSLVAEAGGSTFGTAELYAELQEELTARVREVLARHANALEERGIDASTVIRRGRPAEEILRYAEEIDATMIVLGSNGLRGWRRVFLGSVSRVVAESAKCAVLIGRPPPVSSLKDGGTVADGRMLADSPPRLLVAWDDTEGTRRAIELLVSRGEKPFVDGANIRLVHVRPLIQMYRIDLRQRILPAWEAGAAILQQRMDAAARRFTGAGIATTTEMLESEDVVDALVHVAEERKVDLCVAGRSGRGLLQRRLAGSVASGLAHRAPCSVLIGPGLSGDPALSDGTVET